MAADLTIIECENCGADNMEYFSARDWVEIKIKKKSGFFNSISSFFTKLSNLSKPQNQLGGNLVFICRKCGKEHFLCVN